MNKKAINLFFIFCIGLFLISASYASDDAQLNGTVSATPTTTHKISSDLSNDQIQSQFDSANDGDTFEFTDKEYKNISLVVDKKLNIVSKKGSVVYASDKVSDKAKSLGIDKTFGFYFTSNSAGSVLSEITIKAQSSDYAVIADRSDNITIKDNYVIGGDNGVLIKNSENITISNNKITKATNNGLQLQNVKNSVISKNEIWKNGRSGIETINIYDSKMLNNTIHHNKFNGISMYGISSGSLIKYNQIHNNTNGIYIDAKSVNDVLMANTLSHNRRDSECELGSDDSGNGLLFGAGFEQEENSKILVKYNALIHNEQFQAKNNPSNEKFGLDENWFDSTDDANTYVCPMLFAKILKLDTITIKNGIGLQVKDSDGNPVTDMATFDMDVEVDGNKYTVKVQNDGVAKIQSENIEPNKEYDIKIVHGDKVKTEAYYHGTSGSEQYKDPVDSSNQNTDVNKGSSNQNGQGSGGKGSGYGTGRGNSDSSNSHITNSGTSGTYGTNTSDMYSSSSSDMGENALANGDLDAGSADEGSSGDAAKAYEVVPESKISKSVVDTSGVVILSVMALVVMFIIGYRRKSEFE